MIFLSHWNVHIILADDKLSHQGCTSNVNLAPLVVLKTSCSLYENVVKSCHARCNICQSSYLDCSRVKRVGKPACPVRMTVKRIGQIGKTIFMSNQLIWILRRQELEKGLWITSLWSPALSFLHLALDSIRSKSRICGLRKLAKLGATSLGMALPTVMRYLREKILDS